MGTKHSTLYICDSPACTGGKHGGPTEIDFKEPPPKLPPGWVELREGSETTAFKNLCSWPCLADYANQHAA